MELTKIEQLDKIEYNINTYRKRIMNLKSEISDHTTGKREIITITLWGEPHHTHLIDISQKCLAYWQRAHLRHLNQYPSVSRQTSILTQIGEALQDKPKLSIMETAWLTEIQTLTNLK